jgi:hypothetical protein
MLAVVQHTSPGKDAASAWRIKNTSVMPTDETQTGMRAYQVQGFDL